jgi:ketosteroid isomerase-like protein
VSERIRIVQRSYDAFNGGDIDRALELFDDDITWHTYIVPGPGGGVYRGHAGVRELWSDAKRIFGDFRNVPEEMFEIEDRILIFVHITGVGRESGVAVEARIAHVMTFRGDTVILVQSFEDRDEARRVAGLT